MFHLCVISPCQCWTLAPCQIWPVVTSLGTSSFNRWLSRWCPANNVGYIYNWKSFWGKTWSDYERLTSIPLWKESTKFISHPKIWQPRVETRMQSCSLTHFSAASSLLLPPQNPIMIVSAPRLPKFNQSINTRWANPESLQKMKTKNFTEQKYKTIKCDWLNIRSLLSKSLFVNDIVCDHHIDIFHQIRVTHQS